jgi:hypothetical protein
MSYVSISRKSVCECYGAREVLKSNVRRSPHLALESTLANVAYCIGTYGWTQL